MHTQPHTKKNQIEKKERKLFQITAKNSRRQANYLVLIIVWLKIKAQNIFVKSIPQSMYKLNSLSGKNDHSQFFMIFQSQTQCQTQCYQATGASENTQTSWDLFYFGLIKVIKLLKYFVFIQFYKSQAFWQTKRKLMGVRGEKNNHMLDLHLLWAVKRVN